MKNIKLRVKLMTLSILPMLVIGAVIAAVTLEWLSSTIVDETEKLITPAPQKRYLQLTSKYRRLFSK